MPANEAAQFLSIPCPGRPSVVIWLSRKPQSFIFPHKLCDIYLQLEVSFGKKHVVTSLYNMLVMYPAQLPNVRCLCSRTQKDASLQKSWLMCSTKLPGSCSYLRETLLGARPPTSLNIREGFHLFCATSKQKHSPSTMQQPALRRRSILPASPPL